MTAVEVDPSFAARAKENLDAAQRERVRFETASATATGLPADSFDIAIARFLLTHVPEPAAILGEMYRLLKPGGRAFIIDVDSAVRATSDPPVPELIEASHEVAGVRALTRIS